MALVLKGVPGGAGPGGDRAVRCGGALFGRGERLRLPRATTATTLPAFEGHPRRRRRGQVLQVLRGYKTSEVDWSAGTAPVSSNAKLSSGRYLVGRRRGQSDVKPFARRTNVFTPF